MNQSKISVRYSKALFQTAYESGLVEKIKNDLATLSELIKSEPLFNHLLNTPLIATNQKITVLVNSFSNHFAKITIDFLKLLCRNNRENFIADVIRNFNDLYKKHKGLLSVDLHLSAPISDDLKARIKSVIKERFQKEILFREQINKDLIGGFILQIDDFQYDASISTKLKNIENSLITNNYNKKI